jgi:hypothetical protein
MAYYDLHFMDNILRKYFVALPMFILNVVYRVHGACSNFAGHGSSRKSTKYAITILPPPPSLRLFILKYP